MDNFPSKEAFVELCQKEPEKVYDMFCLLISEITELKKTVKEQSEKISRLEQRNKELEARLNQNSKNSNKPPSSDMFKKSIERKSMRRKSGGQIGHKGTSLKMVSSPTQVIDYPAPEKCSQCNESLTEIKGKITIGQEFELPEMKLKVIEHRVEKKVCKCGFCNIPLNAPQLRNHAFYGNKFKTFVLYLKNHHMFPFARTKELIKDVFNHNISEGTFWNIEKEFSEKLKPVEEIIKQEIIHSKSAGFDETGMRADNRNYWVHTAVTNLFSHFSFKLKRGYDAMKETGILPEFKGIAMHDFFKPYLKFICKHAFCNAHILRELISITEKNSHIWAEMMLQVLIVALDAKKEPGIVSEKTILEISNMYDMAIQKGYEENPDNDIGSMKAKSKEINLLKRLDVYKENIILFLSSPDVRFDNNMAERALRMLKVKNKISGCFRNIQSGEYFCRFRSFIESCKKHDFPIFDSILSIYNSKNFAFCTSPVF